MAKVNSHGQILGRIEQITKTFQYNTDGTVLINYGTGTWKLYGKVKSNLTPQEAYKIMSEKHSKNENENPFYSKYLSKLIEYCGLKRGRIHEVIKSMPNDIDGVWSEITDYMNYDMPKLSIEEVNELCMLYNLMIEERKEKKENKSPEI